VLRIDAHFDARVADAADDPAQVCPVRADVAAGSRRVLQDQQGVFRRRLQDVRTGAADLGEHGVEALPLVAADVEDHPFDAELGAAGEGRLQGADAPVEVRLVIRRQVDQVDAVDEDVIDVAGGCAVAISLDLGLVELAGTPLLRRGEKYLDGLGPDRLSAIEAGNRAARG
jgi:hypothetical protein